MTVARLGAGTNDDRIVVTVQGYRAALFTPWIGSFFPMKKVTMTAPVEAGL